MNDVTPNAPALLFDRSAPRWIFLQLVENCNLRCRMCYEWGDSGAYHEKATLGRLKLDVIRKIIADCAHARPYYELYGGEPLLYSHLEEVLRLIAQAGSKVHLPTNGTLLAKKAEMLVRTPPERIWVSLDGPPEINDRQRGEGVFQRAVEGIDTVLALRDRARQAEPMIGVSTVVTPDNHASLETLFFEALDLSRLDCVSIELQAYITEQNHHDYVGVLQDHFDLQSAPIAKGFVCDSAQFQAIDAEAIASQVERIAAYCRQHGKFLNLYPKVMSVENIRKYFSADWFSMSHVKSRCSFPWISMEINARGDATSCHAFYDLTLGNVNETPILEIWRGEKYERYRKYLRRNLFPICQACCLYYNEKPPSPLKPS